MSGMSCDFPADLSKLLFDFLSGAFRIWPIETNSRSAILKPMRTMQRRQRSRQTVADRFALLRLHSLPRLTISVTIQVRMTRAHLRNQRLRNVARIELAKLFCDYGMKTNLKKNIAELFAHERRFALS